MKTTIKTPVDTALLDQWLIALHELETTISGGAAQEPGWTVTEGETDTIKEDALGAYTAPMLTIHAPDGERRVEPIARNYPGLGIVELYAWPTAYRVRLIQQKAGEWRVLTASGIFLRQPWDCEHFITLVRDLVRAEDMIAAA